MTLLLSVFFPYSSRVTLSYLYTPPTLTSSDLNIYKLCIEFAERHNQYDDFGLVNGNFVSIQGNLYTPDALLFDIKLKGLFSEKDIHKIRALLKELKKANCGKFQRNGDVVIFYKKSGGLTTRLGILYSLNGRDPNKIDSKMLNAMKPFIKVVGDWYTSRHLISKTKRWDVAPPHPRSLIDHSLRLDGIDPNDLYKFD